MATAPSALVTMLVLFAAGLLPALALAGPRVVTLPLAPLAGAVLAALAATCLVAWGWSFLAWFTVLAAVAAVVVVALWIVRPDRRPPSLRGELGQTGRIFGSRLVWALGAAGVVGACVWSLRGLATPTVGFDARAIWLLRAGWFFDSHRQVLIEFKSLDIPLVQSTYPPLVSAVAALARAVTDNSSLRLGVVVVALLNTCALLVATLALLDAGQTVVRHLLSPSEEAGGTRRVARGEGERWSRLPALVPPVAAAAAAVLLVFIAFGITEPFMTNGYADPLWSLAGVGAIAWGLQLPFTRTNQGVAVVMLLVAATTKNEGIATACALVVLLAARGLANLPRCRRRGRWWQPVLVAVGELALIGAWPALMHRIHARGVASSHSPVSAWPSRARATYDWMAPYLHVLVLAVPLALVAGVALGRVRRGGGLGNDLWAWAALASGLFLIGADFVTGSPTIVAWLETTVHRVTEFAALAGWWILAMWALSSSGSLLFARLDPARRAAVSKEASVGPPEREEAALLVDLPGR
jgi:hypothetical protein